MSRGWGPGTRGSVVSPVSPVSPVIWALGSRGESLPVSSGIELKGGNLRLEVTYNPGTGWLYDSSSIEH